MNNNVKNKITENIREARRQMLLHNETEINLKRTHNELRGVRIANKPQATHSNKDEMEKKYVNLSSKSIKEFKHKFTAKRQQQDSNSNLDSANSYRVLKINEANMIKNELANHARLETRRDMNDIHVLKTNIYRPWTEEYGSELPTNVTYRVSTIPDICGSRNAHRPEEALIINDRYAAMNNHNHLRTHVHIDEHGRGNLYRSSYNDHEAFSSIDYRHDPIRRHAYRLDSSREYYNHAYRTEQFLINDSRNLLDRHAIHNYRYDTLYNNVYNCAYRPDIIAMNEMNRAMMSRYEFDTYRRQVALDLYGPRSELSPFYAPGVIMDNHGLGTKSHGHVNSEKPGMFIHNPQITPNNPYRYNREYKMGSEETLLARKRHAPDNVSQKNYEPMTIKKIMNGLNETKYEQSTNTVAADTIGHKNVHDVVKGRMKNQTVLSEHGPVYSDVCRPRISEHKYETESVILSTKNMPQTEYVVEINKTINVGSHFTSPNDRLDEGRKINHNNDRSDIIPGTKTEYDRNIKDNSSVDESVSENAIASENRELDRENNIKFLVVFFNRVKELIKDPFPEFAKSLQKEIETLGTVGLDGKAKRDIQYICPLYCSVSTYSYPRFNNMNDDNKIEKHINSDKICDVCSCIQKCYKLYKKKYIDQLKQSVENGKENVKENYERKTSVIKSVGICKEGSLTRKDNEFGITAEVCVSEVKRQDIEHFDVEHRKFNKNIVEGELAYKITENLIKSNVGKTIFDELSTLTLSFPNNNTNNTVTPNILSNNSRGKSETLADYNVEIIISTKNSQTNENESKINHIKDKHEQLNQIDKSDITSKLTHKAKKPESVFTCHICTCIFSYYSSFISHLRKEHNINDDLPDSCVTRKCPFCGYLSKQKYHNEHVKRAHPEIFAHKRVKEKDAQIKQDRRKKSSKRKFVFICLVCNENLMSYEVNGHRATQHKGVNVPKMFTKRLLSNTS